jgi:hypothetical protein
MVYWAMKQDAGEDDEEGYYVLCLKRTRENGLGRQ